MPWSCLARTLPDALFLEAARTLAGLVREADLAQGCIYPPLKDIRRVSLAIAVAVATKAYALGLARRRRPRDMRKSIARLMYEP